MYIVPFTEIQMEIHEKCPEDDVHAASCAGYMMRIADEMARRDGAQALITGESLGQVASQTMEALGLHRRAWSNMPVFRPLIGLDKLEITQIAHKDRHL